jgi:hypothetical protein
VAVFFATEDAFCPAGEDEALFAAGAVRVVVLLPDAVPADRIAAETAHNAMREERIVRFMTIENESPVPDPPHARDGSCATETTIVGKSRQVRQGAGAAG